MTDAERLAIALTALRTIQRGSVPAGRWIDDLTGDAPDGGDEDSPPDGYWNAEFDQESDDSTAPPYPDGISPEDSQDLRLLNGEWLRPARWEEYTAEDQAAWLRTVATTAAPITPDATQESTP